MNNKDISEREQQRRERQAERERQRQLLYDRVAARRLLGGISIATLIRMEKAGLLQPRKLAGSAHGKTFYTAENLDAVAEQELA